MTSVTVRRDGLDWLTKCAVHADAYWCGDWESAMEAAWGHLAMHHCRETQFGQGPLLSLAANPYRETTTKDSA